ncbi:MAG TPA: hypothetical protein DCS09_07420, partial [Porphyromonadaceae bacterium]|nr:hypothetical protein [Porphyromonadaceae bacterium]
MGIILIVLLLIPVASYALNSEGRDTMESQQTGKTVTGHIADQKGESLIGVNVVEAGTTNGTVTDADGNYTLRLTTSNPILNISYIGFTTQT